MILLKDDILIARKSGVSGYLVKPFDVNTFKARIDEVMGGVAERVRTSEAI